MLTNELPTPIEIYFKGTGSSNIEETLSAFSENAKVHDNGEGRVLTGLEQIRQWMTGTVAAYNLTSEVVSAEQVAEKFVVGVVVTGEFPGSPYKFENRFALQGEQILELEIEPIGSVAE